MPQDQMDLDMFSLSQKSRHKDDSLIIGPTESSLSKVIPMAFLYPKIKIYWIENHPKICLDWMPPPPVLLLVWARTWWYEDLTFCSLTSILKPNNLSRKTLLLNSHLDKSGKSVE